MENDKKLETEDITRKNLEEQTQVILSALDVRLNKTEDDLRSELYAVRNELKTEISKVESGLEEKIDNIQTSVDGFVKKQSDF